MVSEILWLLRKNNLTEKVKTIQELEEDNQRLREEEDSLVAKKKKLQNWYLNAIKDGKVKLNRPF